MTSVQNNLGWSSHFVKVLEYVSSFLNKLRKGLADVSNHH